MDPTDSCRLGHMTDESSRVIYTITSSSSRFFRHSDTVRIDPELGPWGCHAYGENQIADKCLGIRAYHAFGAGW